MTEPEDRAIREDAERERATSEDRATPVRGGETPFHRHDVADTLHPEEPPDPPPETPPARHGRNQEAEPTDGRPI